MLGIVCERKHLRYVNCHSVHEKMFTNLVIQLKFLVINKQIIQENVCKCTKTHEICKYFNIFFCEQFLIYGSYYVVKIIFVT